MSERLGIAGSGAIACGLAVTAASHGEVLLWARSDDSAARARATVEKVGGRLSEDFDATNVKVSTELEALGGATFLVEAIAEDYDAKIPLLQSLNSFAAPEAVLASTTSSLSIEKLAAASGRAEHFVGLHVFNPVPRMKLIELVFPAAAGDDTRTRSLGLCEELGKTAVEVPDIEGFVVNRLLFPYLFSAVALQEQTGMTAEAIDTCMTLGTGQPMGPLALLDFVGLDVSLAIGETIGADIPARVRELAAEGALGKKSGRGFYNY